MPKHRKAISFRLTEERGARLEAASQETGIPKQKILERALDAYLRTLGSRKRR